jgi:hypothetical protein
MQTGRRDEATAAFWKTLAIDPTHIRATENFAGHALDGGDRVDGGDPHADDVEEQRHHFTAPLVRPVTR